jgi:hypothetical protein
MYVRYIMHPNYGYKVIHEIRYPSMDKMLKSMDQNDNPRIGSLLDFGCVLLSLSSKILT